MQDNWHTGYVTRIVQETHNTKRFWIQIRELEKFDYKPGQFVTLDLPIHEEKALAELFDCFGTGWHE